MTRPVSDDSLQSMIIELFEAGGEYTTKEMAEWLSDFFPGMEFCKLKNNIMQIRAALKKQNDKWPRRVGMGSMNLIKDPETRRWSLAE